MNVIALLAFLFGTVNSQLWNWNTGGNHRVQNYYNNYNGPYTGKLFSAKSRKSSGKSNKVQNTSWWFLKPYKEKWDEQNSKPTPKPTKKPRRKNNNKPSKNKPSKNKPSKNKPSKNKPSKDKPSKDKDKDVAPKPGRTPGQ